MPTHFNFNNIQLANSLLYLLVFMRMIFLLFFILTQYIFDHFFCVFT
jgi:hypothetical protein